MGSAGRPSLQLLVAPIQNSHISSSPPASATSRRVTSWGSAVSESGSSIGQFGDHDMTPLPSPVGSVGFSEQNSAPWNHRRDFSGGSDDSSHSGAPRSKTTSFFSDFEATRSAGTLSPPPNPPSRSNSIASGRQRQSRRSWLDSASPKEDDSPGGFQRVSDSPHHSPTLAPTSPSTSTRLPPLPSLPSVDLAPANSPEPESFRSSGRPTLPFIQTALGGAPSPQTSISQSSVPSSSTRPMSSFPSAGFDSVLPPDRTGTRFLDLSPPSRLGTLHAQPVSAGTLAPAAIITSSSSISSRPLSSSVTPTPSKDGLLDDLPPPAHGDMLGQYYVERTLGKGSFSTVALGKWKGKMKEMEEGPDESPPAGLKMGQLVALKLILRRSYDGNERMKISVVREVEVLKRIHHPSLVSLIHSFSTPLYTVLVLDYAAGGELFDFLATSHSTMSEALARRIFGELCLAVGWMHSIFLVHRDIKLENVLLTKRPPASTSWSSGLEEVPTPLVKLTDFGLSRFISPNSPLLSTRCGSEAYAAPELIMGRKYDGRQTDAWALGVVLYALITGAMPFIEDAEGRGRKGYLLRIAKGEYKWPSPPSPTSTSPTPTSASEPTPTGHLPTAADASRLVSPSVKALVGKLLTRDPERRAAVEDVLSMEWMLGEGRPERMGGWVSAEDGEQGRELEDSWSRHEEG